MGGSRSDGLFSGVAVIVLAAVGMLWLVPNHTNPAAGANDLSPALVPQISLGVCLVLGFLMVGRAFAGRRRAAAEERPEIDDLGDTGADGGGALGLAIDLAVWAASCVAVMLLLPKIGFIATGIMLLVGWMVFVGLRSIPIIVAVALILPVLLDRLSWYALTVPLP